MTNTICGCNDACVHTVIDGTVRGTSFEHREVSSSGDAAASERLVHPDEEEMFVQSVLRQASGNAGRIEYAGSASVSAYESLSACESLAAHRGVTLEVVARAAARGTLADVVRLPAVSPERRTNRS